MSIHLTKLFDTKRRIVKTIEKTYPTVVDYTDQENHRLYRTAFRRDSYFFNIHIHDSILASYAEILNGIGTLVNVIAFMSVFYAVHFILTKLIDLVVNIGALFS